jgi:hypothetical protein
MRRKSEILKYKASNQNSKKNSLTKSQKWAQLAKGGSSGTTKQSAVCSQNQDMIPTPTYACGVPGPVMYLYRDISIPLYHYGKQTFTGGIENYQNVDKWNLITENDVYFPNNSPTRVFRIFILDQIDKSVYSYQFQTPFSVLLQAVNNKPSVTTKYDCSINIISVKAEISYNGTAIENTGTTVSYEINNVLFQSGTPSFGVYLYMGMLNITIPQLYTTSGYIYDMILTFVMNITADTAYYSEYTSNIKVYCNLSHPNLFSSYNCVVYTPPSVDYQKIELIGT